MSTETTPLTAAEIAEVREYERGYRDGWETRRPGAHDCPVAAPAPGEVVGALAEWVAAHDAEREAAKAAARVRAREYAKWPALPKRTPKNAVLVSSLPPDEQRRISEQCAKEMAPIKEAERVHRAAQDRLARAVENARAALSRATTATTPTKEP
jgi:hypothetical protein